ncbi:MAG TPA: SPOR domain-containing protein [Luteitalea sp.]|nr:SPOR domain-containing protein [Luteitalea sp.]
MAHDIPDDGFHEIQLSGKQLVFLFMATTVVSVVIFLCGVIVGRGVQNARGTSITDSTSLDPSTAALPDDDATGAPASGKPTTVSGLTYAESLAAKNAPTANVEPGAAEAVADTPTAAPAAETPAATPPPVVSTPAPAAAAKATPPPPAPTPAPAPAAAPTAAAAAGDGGFTVQVTALKNRPEADAVAKRLQSRGYQAYVVGPGGGQVIYKVRVGMNMQRPEADKVMRRLQSEEKFKPWITR